MNISAAEFQVGRAARDITPSSPVWLDGYANRNRKSDAISEPLAVSCLSVADQHKTVLIFTCDLLGIQSHICESLYELIQKETGIGFPDIFISCSHTHFAPALNPIKLYSPENNIEWPDENFITEFREKMRQTAVESLRNMQKVQLETSRIKAPQAAFNRRTIKKNDSLVETNFLYPEDASLYRFSPIDDEITVLRFINEYGAQAILLNYACHPVTGGENHYAISADYPHYFRKILSEKYNCPVFFTLGAAGDVVPLNRYGASRKRLGAILANTVILAERTFTVENIDEIKSDFLTLPVKTIQKVNPAEAKNEFEQALDKLTALKENSRISHEDEQYLLANKKYQAKLTAYYRSLLYPENKYQIRLQLLKIGKTVFAGFPFEVLSEISLKMKVRKPEWVVSSCTGGYQGYLPPAYEYERGGYEASVMSTHFEIGTGDKLLEEVLKFWH